MLGGLRREQDDISHVFEAEYFLETEHAVPRRFFKLTAIGKPSGNVCAISKSMNYLRHSTSTSADRSNKM